MQALRVSIALSEVADIVVHGTAAPRQVGVPGVQGVVDPLEEPPT
jgi:hypothetical protein